MSESEGMDPRPMTQQVNNSVEFCCDWPSNSYSSPMREMEGKDNPFYTLDLQCYLFKSEDNGNRVRDRSVLKSSNPLILFLGLNQSL